MVKGDSDRASGLKGFIAAVRKKLLDNIVASIAGGVLAAGAATALFVWNPLKNAIEQRVTDLSNIAPEEALRIARSTVGSRTIWAAPFRNRDDDNQYIAVWYEAGSHENLCDDRRASTPDWCELALGPIDLDILVGGQGTYERQNTHLTALTQAGGISSDYLAAIAADSGRSILRYWGIVDRDGDGKKEVLTIANSTGTSPTLPIYVSLYETATGQVRQLRSFPSRFSVRNEFYNVGSSSIRSWLIERLKEFRDERGDLCRRDLSGKIYCTISEELAEERANDEDRFGDIYAMDAWMNKNADDWIANNGVDFTIGKIQLVWSNGLFNNEDHCSGRTGRFEWHNVFKGPLVVNDLTTNRRAVAYLQDGDHHREIPALVFGKRYVWLALASDKKILAIDPSTFELMRFDVPEFKNGIPRRRTEAGTQPEMVSQNALDSLKDWQLDELNLVGDHLVYDDIPLTLAVPADEFISATQCRSDGN